MTLTTLSLVLTLYIASAFTHPTNIWRISILEGPAPPPAQGPPISAGATRDRSKLKYEVGGIVAAYAVWTLTAVVLILFVGRRLRRRALSSAGTLKMEMVKPHVDQAALGVAPSPVSPIKQWLSPRPGSDKKQWTAPVEHPHQESHTSLSTFDEKIIEADRTRHQNDLERLYAAVMEHDEEKELRVTPPKSPIQYVPELQHLRNNAPVQQQPLPAPSSPGDQDASQSNSSRASSRITKASPLSFLSFHSRNSSVNSNQSRPHRISFRGQRISQPIGSPDLAQSVAYDDERALTPRVYVPGPPPMIPGKKPGEPTVVEVEKKAGQRAPPPSPLPLRSPANTSKSSLPFRQAYANPPQSAPPTKTTYVERRESKLHPAPKTGVPHTPYSPYMPFTPLTPITPGRLVTKEERKKAQRKTGLKVLVEDDLVKDDDDMWS